MPEARELADLPYAHLLQAHQDGLAAEEEYETIHFDGLDFDDAQAGNARFTECAFTGVTFDGGQYRRARFNDVWLHRTRWVGADFGETDWLDTTALSGVVAGVQAFSARLRRVVFRECKFDSVNFRGAVLRDVVFDGCVLRDVDWSSAAMTNVRFPDTAVQDARFVQATMDKVGFRGTTELTIADGYDSLAGTIMETGQLVSLAPMFAHALGITVTDA